MSTKSDHSLEYYGPQHEALLFAVAASGIDTSLAVDGATRLIGYGDTKNGYGPACFIDIIYTQHVIEPHVTWFPWVGAADKIRNFKWAMNLFALERTVLLNISRQNISFFEHFTKRGFLRKIGYIDNLPIVEEIHMYQVRGDQHVKGG